MPLDHLNVDSYKERKFKAKRKSVSLSGLMVTKFAVLASRH